MPELNDNQKQAVKNAELYDFSLVTGGAGTGKTFTIRSIAEVCKNPVLCAVAGKAAARLRESTGVGAQTIASLLRFDGDGYTAGNLRDVEVIIDEASMVEASLLAEIIKREPRKLVLVGDQAQLLPVGRGAPFHNFLELMPKLTTNLTICYRNTEAIFQAATAIRSGQLPPPELTSDSESWRFDSAGDQAATFAKIKNWVEGGHFDFEEDLIVCPKNDQVIVLNSIIREIVNPATGKEKPNHKWRVGDRIICLKNFAPLDVWNGTTGTITAINNKGEAWVKGDIPFYNATTGRHEKEILWRHAQLGKSQHAYALTVHKAQGSQYRNVVFVCLMENAHFMRRNLIYTAVTRARQNCVAIGDNRALAIGIKRVDEKLTLLKEKFAKQWRAA